MYFKNRIKTFQLLFLITIIFSGCETPQNQIMNFPTKKPEVLKIKNEAIQQKHTELVMERYLRTKLGNETAYQLYADGKLYIIAESQQRNNNVKTWKLCGQLSQRECKRIKKIVQKNQNYISNKAQQEISLVKTKWYFYYEQALYFETQKKQWALFDKPRFIKRIEKILENSENSFVYKSLKQPLKSSK